MGIVLVVYASTVIASRNTIYYYTTSETLDIETSKNERIKLGGFVVENSISKDGEFTSFTITDGNKDIKIIFDGFIPDLFQENMGVILDGVFDDENFEVDVCLQPYRLQYRIVLP